MNKIFVVGRSIGYARWINGELCSNLDEADIVVFTGGEDINPALYGKKPHESTYFNDMRDNFELEIYNRVRPDQLCYGTCRGLQLGAALNGAILVQNVNNHWCSEMHGIITRERNPKIFNIPSLHHQMVYPYEMNPDHYTVLATSSNRRSRIYEGDGIGDDQIRIIREYGEPEIVLFHVPGKPKFFGVQGHPEMMPTFDTELHEYLNNKINSLIAK